jgi:hypothetical protein
MVAQRLNNWISLPIWIAALLLFLAPTNAGAQQCVGDCDGNCIVDVSELTSGIGIGLGTQDADACPSIDMDEDGAAGIDELVVAVSNAITGCPATCATTARLTHNFGDLTLASHQEIASQCVSWTLNNDEPLYVSKITLSNGGGYHHSNWFVVPEDLYPGPDGFFRCSERGFDELTSAVNGTVIFAQSTQSLAEDQKFAPGAAIKIPPRHKVVAGVHALNLQNRAHTTFLRMSLGLVHPRDVEVILAPFRLTYLPLDIPPEGESHFTIDCDLAGPFEGVAKRPFDLKLYWVLPHYHELGNYFRVEVMGGPADGQLIHSLDTFNAEPNGKALDPPLDLTGATGLRLTCGYYNPRTVSVGWGIGDQEMCVMLGLADSDILMDAAATDTNIVDGVVDGVVMNHSACRVLALPRNAAQTLPSDEERGSPLYVPESLPEDFELPPIPECKDTPDAVLAEQPAALSSLRETVFRGSCTFSACHDMIAPAAGLDLASDDVHQNLLSHAIVFADTELPLVAPGDPDGSWLMNVISKCEPTDDAGTLVNHMPRNSPTLLPPELVAKVRDWILMGAEDN